MRVAAHGGDIPKVGKLLNEVTDPTKVRCVPDGGDCNSKILREVNGLTHDVFHDNGAERCVAIEDDYGRPVALQVVLSPLEI